MGANDRISPSHGPQAMDQCGADGQGKPVAGRGRQGGEEEGRTSKEEGWIEEEAVGVKS